jgi:signal transduction histidine kinase
MTQSTGINGYLRDFLLKYWPAMADPTFGNLFITGFVFFHVAFLRELLLDKEKTPKRIYKFSIYLGRLSIVLALVMTCCLIDNRLFFYMSYLVYFVYSCMIINLILNLIQGFKYNKQNALFILISNTPFCFYLLYMVLTNLRILKQNSPYNIVMWCIIFDNIILCIGLAFRFNFVSKRELLLQKRVNKQQIRNFEIDRQRQEEKISKLEAQFKLKDEKERISKDLHDNIGSQLAYITSNIDYFSSKLKGSSGTKIKLDALSDYVRFTTQQLRDTIWAINKEQILISEFVKRTRSYVSKQIEPLEKLAFEMEYIEHESEILLSSNQTLNLFRTIQEAVHNITKHSKATELKIKLKATNKAIDLEIKDNGVGFILNQKTLESYGLENMMSRINDINGKLEIITSPGKGTQINAHCDF